MTLELCGKCLHNKKAHTPHTFNFHNEFECLESEPIFMYCGLCHTLCETIEFNQVHKPTDIQTVMEIGAKKQ